MYAEVAWVLVFSGIQVQPQVILDPDYLPDYLSVSYDYAKMQFPCKDLFSKCEQISSLKIIQIECQTISSNRPFCFNLNLNFIFHVSKISQRNLIHTRRALTSNVTVYHEPS